MKLATVIVVLAICLGFQTALGSIWSEASRFVDVMMVPVVWYAISGSQRSGMMVGCAAGLLQDSWFQTGAFGISGFKKTLVGWILGGLGSRFDLNHTPSRFVFGTLATLADGLIGRLMRGMLDQPTAPLRLADLVVRSLVTGILVVTAYGLTEWLGQRRRRRSLA
jgi:rod shape-determining protein MreD